MSEAQAKTTESYQANGWEYMRTMITGTVVLEIVDITPAGEELPLIAFIYNDGSAEIM